MQPISRAAPEPVRRPVFSQQWNDLTYLHWPYEPAQVAPHLPPGVVPDTVDGAAWVGLIPFRMQRVRILGAPPLPYLSSFLETNVRTYGVDAMGRRVVVFLSLDADRLLPVLTAQAAYRLPYRWARMTVVSTGDLREYRCRRRATAGAGSAPASTIRLRIGARIEPSPLDDFLSARWGLASRWYGRTVHAPVEHEPWVLHAAELLELDDGLIVSHGLPAPSGAPRVLWSPGVTVRIGRPSVIRSERGAGASGLQLGDLAA